MKLSNTKLSKIQVLFLVAVCALAFFCQVVRADPSIGQGATPNHPLTPPSNTGPGGSNKPNKPDSDKGTTNVFYRIVFYQQDSGFYNFIHGPVFLTIIGILCTAMAIGGVVMITKSGGAGSV
ncbi:hypothetical protein NEHOM01_2105 [Nematocida homosporus]|uniref:uncharacterized protein n=1 Tax=Nematocida homosporus TaxID=1912981 RepID=UPI00221FD32B|nr:uncharacterized protein NEHOM01_2105 [Nematocida homosporus]KAI5187343.1 hypothetical protein NEHOM01_2105 [Nematocida homosporus]